MQRMLLLCCLLVAVSAAWCRTVKLPAAFDNGAYPVQVTLGELTADWFKVKVPVVDGGDTLLLLRLMVTGMPGQELDLSLTQGQLVNLSGRLYLVVYQLKNQLPPTAEGMGAQAALTPQTLLYPSLVSMSDLMTLIYAGPFNLEQEMREQARMMEERARMMEERARQARERADREVLAEAGHGDNEARLKGTLRLMRQAINRFKADTGAYPAALADLVLPREKAPANGIDADGKPVAIAAGTYAGPYLPAASGVPEAPGIPPNPYVDTRHEVPNPALVSTHWQYKNGFVGVPEYLFGILTSDGRMLGEL
ncbi:MAG: hypothetical protein ACYC6A_17135 [Armatimonadota bacterium]